MIRQIKVRQGMVDFPALSFIKSIPLIWERDADVRFRGSYML